MKQLHLKIYGNVQGVNFRSSSRKKAQELNLLGWVKNCTDGTAEITAQGLESNLKEFFIWCQRGPEHAKVKEMDEEWSDIDQVTFENFNIIY